MKHLFTAQIHPLPQGIVENIPEGHALLLQGQPFSDRVKIYIEIGELNNSEALAEKIGQYVHGRRWATLTRNDGHYIEVEAEEHDDTQEASGGKSV